MSELEKKIAIGLRIRDIRKQTGLSQAEFAGKIGMASNSISEIEGGKRGVSKPVALAIEYIWQINADWLLSGEGLKRREAEYSQEAIPAGQAAQSPAEYKPIDPEAARLYSQVQRIVQHGEVETVGKLKGFLAALDPGEIVGGEVISQRKSKKARAAQ